jgi:hypothetical protein
LLVTVNSNSYFFISHETKLINEKMTNYKKNMMIRIKFVFLVFITCSLLLIRCNLTRGNPIPVDINWETSPVSRNNSSVIFKQEVINVTFDSTKANFTAFYTFKNIGSIVQELGILLPFVNYGSSTRPKNVLLHLNKSEIDYIWQDVNNVWEYGEETYQAITFNLSFNPNEEKVIKIEYYRDYMIYDSVYNNKAHYHFRYLVGTVRNWNHPIDSAYFEFWIPKHICDGFEWAPYVNDTWKTINNAVKEDATYYIASLEFENWTLPNYIGWIPAYDFITLYWTKARPSVFDSTIIFILSVFQAALIGFCVIVIPSFVVYHKRKKVNASSTFLIVSSIVALITGSIYVILGLLQPLYLLGIGILIICIGVISFKYNSNLL